MAVMLQSISTCQAFRALLFLHLQPNRKGQEWGWDVAACWPARQEVDAEKQDLDFTSQAGSKTLDDIKYH